jgi:hypothetical protein
MPRVEVTVGPDGTTRVEAHEVKGALCQKLTEQIERAIGATTAEAKKAEFHQTQSATQGQQAWT